MVNGQQVPNGSAAAPPPAPSPPPPAAAAAAAAAGKAAGGTAAAGKGIAAGLASWWSSLTSAAEPVKQQLARMAKDISKMKGMPVDVKVDFLRPTAEAVKDSVSSMWVQLPPPVQQAAPFVGVALGSGLVVFAIQQHRLNLQRKKTADVRLELQGVLKERGMLLRQINDLQTKPRTDVEIRLANSVAVATNAAAAAAEAAARAAVACAVQKSPRASLALPAPGAPPAEGGPLGD